ncbi:MAG: NAD(P)/FAD-dependent oxidoreductase [bacterium]|nr:NAD(P)/FAD-dependent oxidoreductase [bacterium]
MITQHYQYIIIGGGLAGVSAIAGIRERDTNGSILLLSDENQLPYDRPPLSKKLWFGKKKVEDIFLHNHQFYTESGVKLTLGTKAVAVDAIRKLVFDNKQNEYHYEKLLIATGGNPRLLPIEGGNLDGLIYFRTLDDYLTLKTRISQKPSVLIIGGGFIGTELAAALNMNQIEVTMLFPEAYPVSRVFPESLGKAIQSRYLEHGIKILNEDKPISISKLGNQYITKTESAKQIVTDLIVIGIGIIPETGLAAAAGLKTGNGILVNEYLQTSNQDIYAAGDNTLFPYQALGQLFRVEHWDNALNQGKYAGRNMAGANESYDYMPYFFSDLFEFGYEAVGEINSTLETFADWQEVNHTGVIYYLQDNIVRGVMLCNVWDKVEQARELIRKAERVTPEKLVGLIR